MSYKKLTLPWPLNPLDRLAKPVIIILQVSAVSSPELEDKFASCVSLLGDEYQMEPKVITKNRRARHEYFIEDTFEAGIVLSGTEVKSLRLGRGNLNDSYAGIVEDEPFLYNCHISPYDFGNRFNHDPLRPRKLLLHKEEVRRLHGKIKEKGMTLVPLTLYFDQNNRVKVELALAKGKKLYDKREDLAKRDAKREMERAAKGRE